MADGFTVDFHELNELAQALGEVASSAGPYVRAATETSAINVRDDWKSRASGMKGLAAYPGSIGYDFVGFQGFGSTVLSCEIGPDRNKKQGTFGGIVEYGAPHFAPRHYGDQALEAESANFERLLDEALQKAEQALTFGGIVRSVITGRNTIL
ncbi:hypothetical protein [Curtobacterium sp. MCBD17_003]|uniref:hypothetical protein n=1 Tax=Curtobacterium sp. MCBD17_003 TaxID=2175667 RepID=UPI000DA8CD85|nr:hypothetical protein [Curtobacterium sp. MCBD17_003]WIE54226.1 hypothetical protein DEI88_014045 [Curtobacterium sp. MCBD17_003]